MVPTRVTYWHEISCTYFVLSMTQDQIEPVHVSVLADTDVGPAGVGLIRLTTAGPSAVSV